MKTRIALLIVFGLFLGLLGATYIHTVEQPEYESAVVYRPVRPKDDTSGVSHREWLNTEAAVLVSPSNLRKVARNLNLGYTWKMSDAECVGKLRGIVQVSLPGDASLITIRARGTKSIECAAIVNQVLRAREEMVREVAQTVERGPQQAYEARVKTLKYSSAEKRAELVAAMKKANAEGDFSDASLTAATLAPELSKMRDAWQADAAQLAYTREKLAAALLPRGIPIYAEILQRGEANIERVGPLWFPRASRWAATGAGVGLVIGLLLEALRRGASSQPTNAPPAATPLTAADF